MKKAFYFFIYLNSVFSINSCSEGGMNKKIIRVSHGQPSGHPDDLAMIAFKNHIEEKLGDKYIVEVYANGLLAIQKHIRTLPNRCH